MSERLLTPEGYFRRNKVTVVLATHTRMPSFNAFTHKSLSITAGSLLPFADDIVQLENGMKVDNLDLQSLESPYDIDTGEPATKPQPDTSKKSDTLSKSEQLHRSFTEQEGSDDSEASGSWRKEGDWSVYGYYVRSAGVASCALFITFIFVTSFSTNFPSK